MTRNTSRRNGRSTAATQSQEKPFCVMVWFCTVGAVLALAAWLVNVDVALRHAGTSDGVYLQALLPSFLYGFFAAFAVDMSTIATAIPVFVFGFPAVAGHWFLRRNELPSWAMHGSCPYPIVPVFMVLIFLGLFGTLVGMLIGLPRGTVDAEMSMLGEGRRALDSLVAGFRTAIWSSLVGLGAVPVAWSIRNHFQRLTGFEVAHEELSATVDVLQRKLRRLGQAAERAYAALGGFQERLDQGLSSLFSKIDERFATIVTKLNEVIAAQRQTNSKQDETNRHSALIAEQLTRGNKQLSTQNDLLSTQNDLLSTQNDLLSTQNDLLSTQNDLLSTQNDLLSTQNEVRASLVELMQRAEQSDSERHVEKIAILNEFLDDFQASRVGLRESVLSFTECFTQSNGNSSNGSF